MALSSSEQFFSAIARCQNPLILLSENPSGDALSAAYALSLEFERLGKSAEIVYRETFASVYDISFLPHAEVKHDLVGIKDFVLIFNTSTNGIENVRTEREGDTLRIFLTPEKNAIDPRDFSFVPANMRYDCAFLLGVRDKESLGRLYEDNADVFFEIPLINIDVSDANERYAQTNVVEVTASSVSELVARLFVENGTQAIASNSAQCLLTGIMLGTDSFRSSTTTPKTFETAVKLIDAGADQQEIVKRLYKTQPLHILKLFGRVLERLRIESQSGLAWAMVELEDFVQSRSDAKHLVSVLERLRSYYSEAKCVLLVHKPTKTSFSGVLYTKNPVILEKLSASLTGSVCGEYFFFESHREFSEDFIATLERVIESL